MKRKAIENCHKKLNYAIGERERCYEQLEKKHLFSNEEVERLFYWRAYWTGQIEALNGVIYTINR